MTDERPTTLLDDRWGVPRPLSDAELARPRWRLLAADLLRGLAGLLLLAGSVALLWLALGSLMALGGML